MENLSETGQVNTHFYTENAASYAPYTPLATTEKIKKKKKHRHSKCHIM